MYQESDSWRVGLRQAACVGIFVFRNGDEPHLNNVQLGRFGGHRTNVWHYPAPTRATSALIGWSSRAPWPRMRVLNSTTLIEIVHDPYRGSGTSVLAAERAGKRRRGIKLDPLYVGTAIPRCEAFAGQLARERSVAL